MNLRRALGGFPTAWGSFWGSLLGSEWTVKPEISLNMNMDRQADKKKLFRPRQHWLLSRNKLAMTAIGTFIVYLRTSNSKFYGLTRIKVQKTIHGSSCFHRFLTADTFMHKLCTSPLLLLIRECSGEMENREMWVGTQQCGQNMVIYCDLETVIWGEMLKGYRQR